MNSHSEIQVLEDVAFWLELRNQRNTGEGHAMSTPFLKTSKNRSLVSSC